MAAVAVAGGWGGGGLSKAKRNQCSFNKEDLGGREKQTVLCMTGPVSALSPAPQIQETGKYFNCKQPQLDSLRGPPVRLLHSLLTHLLSPSCSSKCRCVCTCSTLPMYSIGYNYPTKPGCIGIVELMMPHVISDTCILQLPSKSTIIQISQDTSSRGEARWIPVINPRLHPVPLHQASELQCAGVEKKKLPSLSRICEANTGTLERGPGLHWGSQVND